MSDVEIEFTGYDAEGLPAKGKATAHILRTSIGEPPAMGRREHTVYALRVAANIANATADWLEQDKDSGKYTTHLKIPRGEW